MTSAAGAVRVLYVGGKATATGTEPAFLETDGAESAVEGEESAVDGVEFAVEVANDAAGALDRLATDGVDCVVSEYELPDGDGVELLRTVREAHGDLPFVLYTDAGSERVASEAVAAGVTDYVPKTADTEHAAVLATRIADAVDRRRAERNYRELFRSVSAGVVVHDVETGEIVDANDRMAAILGCEREALLTTSVADFTADDPRFTAAAARRRVRDAVADGPQTFEWLVETKDGEDVWVEVDLDTVDIDGCTRVLATVRDISERKRGRAEREATTRKLQGILDTVSVGIVLKDTDGRYQLMNEAARQWAALDDETVVGRTDEELFPPDIAAELEAADRRVLETGETIERELELPLDGEDRTFLTRRSPIFDEQGGIEAVCTVATDITARKERERERAVRSAAMETSIDGMAILDETGVYQFVNRAHADVYGYDDPEAFLGESWELCYGDDELARIEAEVLPVLEQEGSWRGEAVGTREDGSTFPQEVSLTTTDDGGIVCVVRDITERRERERELRRNERRFEAVFEDPKMLVGLLDVDGTLLQVNGTAMEYVDVDREAVIGEPLPETPWWTAETRPEVREWIERAATGEYVEFEIDLQQPDGETYTVNGTVRPVTDEDGEVVSLIISDRDVTERKRREQALRESEARYQSLTEDALDTSEVGTIILDSSFDVVWINSAMEGYFGVDREALIGQDKRELLQGELADVFDQPDDAVDRLLAAYRDNTSTEEFECSVRSGEGPDERWLKHWSQPITSGLYEGGRIEHYTDISDRKERDRQLQVLGRVLRHNFHNEMNVILGNAELIADEAPGSVGDRAETIMATGEELLELTDKQRQIVDLLSKDPGAQPVEIADQVRHSVDLLRERHPEATVTTAIPDAVRGAAIPQFEQSVTELLENAVVHSDRAAPQVDVSVHVSAETIRIRVADDGPGIPVRERAILRGEREISQLYHGRGMGLWLVHWITTNSGGTLSFEENEPRGSVVELALPRPAGDGDGIAAPSAGD